MILHGWHTMLNMPKYDENWHKQDMADEIAEYEEATGIIDTWSELSDVAYTYTRAKWSGHTIDFPLSKTQLSIGIIYMLPKYTLRWRFFRRLGHYFSKDLNISEVRNPKKLEKLESIAKKYTIDPKAFQKKAEEMLKRTILLK